jgi:gas vesicle protein
VSKDGRKWALGTIFVAAAGYVAGVLTAPKSGKETREDIQEAAHHTASEAERNLKDLHNELDHLIDEATLKAENLKATAKKDVQAAAAKAAKAKEKVRVVLTAVHEGSAVDKDLQKATEDAKKAVDHLKKFITKDA